MALLIGIVCGVLHDVFANKIPSIFQATESLYSIVSLAGVLSYIFLKQLGFDIDLVNMLSIGNIGLPQFKVKSF